MHSPDLEQNDENSILSHPVLHGCHYWKCPRRSVRCGSRGRCKSLARGRFRSEDQPFAGLTLHASFDKGLDADFARGDKTCYVLQGKDLVTAAPTDEVRLAPEAGRFGGALHFTKKNNFRPAFKDAGVLGYNDKNWNATVSVWLRLNPDKDLEPGYCDPVQIVGDDSKKGFIFLEWSKDETPRFFRYAIRPLFHIWNPDNVQWDRDPVRQAADGASGAGAVFARGVDARGFHAGERQRQEQAAESAGSI